MKYKSLNWMCVNKMTIYFCDICNQYWKDESNNNCVLDWCYCDVNGHELKDCPICQKAELDLIEELEDEETGFKEDLSNKED